MTLPVSLAGDLSCPDDGVLSAYAGVSNVRKLYVASDKDTLYNIRIDSEGGTADLWLEFAPDVSGEPGAWASYIILPEVPPGPAVPFWRRVTVKKDQEPYVRTSLAILVSPGPEKYATRYALVPIVPPDASYEVLVGGEDMTRLIERVQIQGPSWDRAGSARLTVTNKGGEFDPLVSEWAWSDTGEPLGYKGALGLFAENKVVQISRWWGGNKEPVFYGLIAKGSAGYERNSKESLEIQAIDRSKNFMERKVTTQLYENMQANDIVRHAFTNYGGLLETDIELAALDYLIPQVQFVDETLMDVARIALAPKGYRVYFDARGKLISVPPPAGQPVKEYRSRVRAIQSEWGDAGLPNKVVVYGRTLDLFEPVLEEQAIGTWTGRTGLWCGWAEVTAWYSADHKMKAKDPRLGGTDLGGGWFACGNVTQARIVSVADYYCVVQVYNREATWNSGEYSFTIYAKPLGTAVPGVILAEAEDELAIAAQSGEVVEEIEDLPIHTYETAKALADLMIQQYGWLRRQVTAEIVGGVPDRGGDIVRIYNARAGTSHDIFVTEASARYERGKADIVEIRGGIALSRPAGVYRIWTVGRNHEGQLGIGSRVDQNTYQQVNLDNVIQVAFGSMHGLALLADGTVWAWGSNDYGQLGIGSTEDQLLPVQVPGLANISYIAVGREFSFAVAADGTAWAWGRNGYGQLADGTTTQRNSPVAVPALAGAKAISGGAYHIIALMADGTVKTCGYNSEGQLGDGTTTDRYTPVVVQDLPQKQVAQIVGSARQSYVRFEDGTVWAWGRNDEGELADGTFTDRLLPVQSLISDVAQLNCRVLHAAAVKSDGSLWAWGANGSGQLGDGTTTNRNAPVQVSLPKPVKSIGTVSRGHILGDPWGHTVAILDDGTVWVWGDNMYGQLGLGVTGGTYMQPTQVPGISDAVAVLSYRHESTGLIRKSV